MFQIHHLQVHAMSGLKLFVPPFVYCGLTIPKTSLNSFVSQNQNYLSCCIRASSESSTLEVHYNAMISHRPSLSRGQKIMVNNDMEFVEEDSGSKYLDKRIFTRAFDIAALRVPADECHRLQTKLKGHLLNWPRIKNIARVPGDDIDPDLKELFWNNRSQDEQFFSSGSHGKVDIVDPVLERAELANKFNSRGFIYFRNLAKISRPKRRKKKPEGEKAAAGSRKYQKSRKDEFAMVELVEDSAHIEGDEDMSGLLGEGYKAKTWKGPTRLLLLDERHAKKPMLELPRALQVVLRGVGEQSRKMKIELVQCRLILSYDYWQMDEVLEELLPMGVVVPTGFETVGHIAHLNLKTEHLPYRYMIAQVVLDKNRPNIQSVVNKTDTIQNDYRTMQLEILAGNHSLVTIVVENGIRFHVDLAVVYWNSRLGTERQRLLNNFRKSDIVCDVFSGVGPLAIAAARKVFRVYANDLNPYAVKYLMKNVACNKLQGKVEVFNLDGRRFIKEMLGHEKPVLVSQVVMNLPNDAAEYLDVFRGVFREEHKNMDLPLPTIHVYGFSKASIPESEFLERIGSALGETPTGVNMHRVRLVAPGKWMLCATFVLPKRVAFTDM